MPHCPSGKPPDPLENPVPHVAVKLYAGKSEEEKQRIAEAMTQALKDAIGSTTESVSVSIEDVQPSAWMDEVFEKDIVRNKHLLYKRPGYAGIPE